MSRDRAELNSLFGRVIVQDAIARRFLLEQWEKASIKNQTEVIKAIQRLEPLMQSPPDAVRFCQGLKSEVRGCLILAFLDT